MNPSANIEVDNKPSKRKSRRRAARRQNFSKEFDNFILFG
jgi:hypothetical protein